MAENPAVKLEKELGNLVSRRISDLDLRIEGSHLEVLTQGLYRELEEAGISLRPRTYLSDEWGCPQGVPIIGIPFYLADPLLSGLEGKMTGTEAENEAEIVGLLRHEAGHAFNYAYLLYQKAEWRRIFGSFSKPYQEIYRPVPFSARFVRHVPAWYSQKHPDDDFAETFAVRITPGSEWRQKYAETPALKKLLYVDRLVQHFGRLPPIVTEGREDRPLSELTMTLEDWYKTARASASIQLQAIIDEDLRKLFPGTDGRPVANILVAGSRSMMRDLNGWTGLDRHLAASLIIDLTGRVNSLGLKTGSLSDDIILMKMAVFATTLAMNYQARGRFMDV